MHVFRRVLLNRFRRLPWLAIVPVVTASARLSSTPSPAIHTRIDSVVVEIGSPRTLHRPSRCIPERSGSSTGPVRERHAASATFTISGAGYDETVTYTESANLIFCRRPGRMVWIRLAAETRENGEDGPHLDLDLCNMTASATFTPMDARGQPCPGGTTWGIWWHDGPDKVYANTATSSPCALALRVVGNSLEGTFECRGLLSEDGTSRLNILNGSFRCTMDKQEVIGAGQTRDRLPIPAISNSISRLR